MVTIPEVFKSSKGDGNISRTIKGIAGLIVFFVAANTALTEGDVTEAINLILIAASAVYSLYGLYRKWQNAGSVEKK